MGPFDLDFSHVRNVVAPPDRIPVLGNEHRMVRVAFDLFRLDGDKEERLWQVQTAEDGNEFLVRTYDLPEDVEDGLESRSSDWSVMTDAKLANLTIAYKRVPVHRLAAADYGASDPDQVRLLRDLVSEKLATDEAWAGRLLRDLPPAKLAALGEAFPDLSKAAQHPGGPPLSADDPKSPDEAQEKRKVLWELRTELVTEVASRGYMEPRDMPEDEQAVFRAALGKLREAGEGKAAIEEAAALVEKFKQLAPREPTGHADEGIRRMLRLVRRREMDAIGRLRELAIEMGQGGHYERHEIPMAVFHFNDEPKAAEFLERADKIGYYGTLVGPGWAAVKLPGL